MNSPAQPMPTPAAAMTPRLFTVEQVVRETHDTFTIEIKPAEAPHALAFRPGQFNMLYAHGVGECAISLSGNPDQASSWRHTIRQVGLVTRHLNGLETSAPIGVRGPFGSAWPVGEAQGRDVLFIAGGIGIAPLRPAILAVLNQRARFGQVSVLYGARTPQDLVFADDLRTWQDRIDVKVTVDRSAEPWPGRVGVVTGLIKEARFDPSSVVAFICGPEVMMRFTARELMKVGVPPAQLHITMERNMKCAIGLCGHCQLGPAFICKDGPVFRYDQMSGWMDYREL